MRSSGGTSSLTDNAHRESALAVLSEAERGLLAAGD